MKLQLDIINIKGVEFGKKTIIKDKVLYINRQELNKLLLQDKRLSKVDIELTYPGESCRILQVADVIEPRARKGGEDFPGVLGKIGSAGEGSTCVLRGVGVVINNQSNVDDLPEVSDALGFTIDMSGPGAALSLYAKLHNVVVVPYPAAGASQTDYSIALKIAGLKTAVYLAQASKELEPDEVEVYELPPLTEVTKGIEGLPKLAYIFQVYCTSYPAMVGEPILYGDNIRLLLPVIIHPNEVLDGAIVNPYHGRGTETYIIQNHPIIKELYRKHGKELCFVGVILTISRYTEPERERSAAIAANQAKSILGADGVILTKASGGAPDIDAAQTAMRCEKMGVKTALIMFDVASGMESGSMFNFPEINAIVNTGNEWMPVHLPSVKRTIGKRVILPSGLTADGELDREICFQIGVLDQEGHSKTISVRY